MQQRGVGATTMSNGRTFCLSGPWAAGPSGGPATAAPTATAASVVAASPARSTSRPGSPVGFRPAAAGGPGGVRVVVMAHGSRPPVASNDQPLASNDQQGQTGGTTTDHGDQDNPFAPPPEGAPDRPWEPRTPPDQRQRPPAGGDQPDQRRPVPWGARRPEQRDSGDGSRNGGSGGTRFDVTDPTQRRARYALLSGMWAFFFVIFSIPYLALLLGALAVHWGISSLRGRGPSRNNQTAPASAFNRSQPDAGPAGAGRSGRTTSRPQFATAVSGLVSGGVALAMVFGLFGLQIVYRDYYECVSDSLTSAARASCDDKIPSWVERVAGENG